MIQELFSTNPHLLFYAVLGLSVLVIRLPVIGIYFRTVNTLLHESGHALAAIVTSGEVVSVSLSNDTSGTALTKSGSKTGALLVSISGYPVAALLSGIITALSVTGKFRTVFFLLLSVSLLNLILFVRNLYGILWLFTFSGLILLVFWLGNPSASHVFALSVSLISLSETVLSTIIILFLSWSHPKKAGDVTNLARISGIPAPFWGILIATMVAFIVYYTVMGFFPYPFTKLN